MRIKNYYLILGLNPFASNEEIKKAYKLYASKFHPDKHQGDNFFEDRFKEIAEAYEYLSDPIKKRKLDDQLNPQTSNHSCESKSSKDNDFRQGKSQQNPRDSERQESPKEKFKREEKEKRKKDFMIGIATAMAVVLLVEIGGDYGRHMPIVVFFVCWTIRQIFLVIVSFIPD